MLPVLANAPLLGKRILVRVDFNVPLDAEGAIQDDRRVTESLPTIRHILSQGASVVLMSHMGRPKGQPVPKYSLKPVQDHLAALLHRDVYFVPDCISPASFGITDSLAPGDVVLLENLRFYPEEEKGDLAFAKALSLHGDVFVNDAFGAAHRAHASVSVIAQFFKEKYAGLLLEKEVNNAEKVLQGAQAPFVAIIGGAKVSDKIGVIQNLIGRVQHIIIGGGMAYTFFKAMGHSIGTSLVEEDKLELAADLLSQAKAKGVQIHLPEDSVVAERFVADAPTQTVSNTAIPDGFMGLDIGPVAVAAFSKVIASAKTILWNGPMGVFEMPAFAQGTLQVAQAIAAATDAGAYSLVGGGDSAAAIAQVGLEARISYVSTGGGALLEYLEGKTLPGVAALSA